MPLSSSSSSLHPCKHSPSATLDLLILILVVFSGAFLISSYFSYLIHSLSLLSSHFPSIALSLSSLPLPLILLFSDHDHDPDDEDHDGISLASFLFVFAVFFAASVAFLDLCCGSRSRRCRNPKCKGLKKAMEFDLQLQTEESVRTGSGKEIERLPWKGGVVALLLSLKGGGLREAAVIKSKSKLRTFVTCCVLALCLNFCNVLCSCIVFEPW
ncbi:hypothetical protein F2Q69_00044519 [Brassica cretica]|uniref:Transmembrane protein n=1 Tax=Brassica cretica TaxID=69181 RepID=A0A8S9N9T9_BRACR|nr:hypothetical protein F2Q69_00044519 [Brassica cretica]